MICIVDYGAGNLKSILNMFNKVGADAIISNNPSEILKANKLLLPGVGHFDYGMKMLRESNLIEVLNSKVLIEKVPILGICLGSQLLGESSEEGTTAGLGWIPMISKKFDHSGLTDEYKIPHMGWNQVQFGKEIPLFNEMENPSRFYFAHSYYLEPNSAEGVIGITNYGKDFCTVVQKENIIGLQFHPEKSHRFGKKVLSNFNQLY